MPASAPNLRDNAVLSRGNGKFYQQVVLIDDLATRVYTSNSQESKIKTNHYCLPKCEAQSICGAFKLGEGQEIELRFQWYSTRLHLSYDYDSTRMVKNLNVDPKSAHETMD
ncbi:hypothetical protein TWF132_004867 [Orbilia oligospora]|nr:hypothetical protein TWF132_004867 [Orbilia oligospora]